MSSLATSIIEALRTDTLNLIIFPTEQCNFRCTYCYESFEVGRMKDDVVQGIKNLLSNRIPDLSSLTVSWFGGEPLLATDIIYSVSEHIVREARNHPRLKYSANITTNGFLLDLTTARRLTPLGVRLYQISLDGDRSTHNRSRRKANGKGTYDQIWERLLHIRDSSDIQAQVMLRVHFSPDTWQQILPLLDQINVEFAEDPRFTVYFKSIERLGGPFDELIGTFTEDAQEKLISHFQSCLKYSRMLSTLQHATDYVCYAAKANSIAIRATGEIAKCTVALQDKRNNVGRLNKDGSLEINNLHFRQWLVGLQSGSKDDLACPYGNMQTVIRPNEISVGLPIDFSFPSS